MYFPNALILAMVTLMINLHLSDQFFKQFEVSRSCKFSNFLKVPSSFEPEDHMRDEKEDEIKIKKDLFVKGLNLWNKILKSNEAWNEVEPTDTAFEIAMGLSLDSKYSIIGMLNQEPEKLELYPMIPDVIAQSVEDYPMNDADIIEVINFFFDHKMYSQLACMIILHDPLITVGHFKNPSIEDLIRTLEHIFMMKPDRLYKIFEPFGPEQVCMIGPLIACTQQISEIVKEIVTEMIKSQKVASYQVIAFICLGIMLTEINVATDKQIFRRNEHLIDYLYTIIDPFKDHSVLIALKACRVINMIKFNPGYKQQIISTIYMDETEESVRSLFVLLLDIAKRLNSDYYGDLIKQYQLTPNFSIFN